MSKPRRNVLTFAVLLAIPLIGILPVSSFGGQRQKQRGGGNQKNPPTISSYSPTSIAAGSGTFLLNVSGTNFIAGSLKVSFIFLKLPGVT